jgi:hypothetical protein
MVPKLTKILGSFLDALTTGTQLIAMIARINAVAKKVEKVLTELGSNGVSPNICTGRGPFSLSVFRDDTAGYYMKSAAGGIHEFHPHCDFLHASTSHLNKEELELQQ